MDDIEQLAAALYRSRVERARRADPEQKLRDGPRLFDDACRVTMAGIRSQFPDADEERVLQILRERLALRRRLEGGR